MRVLWVVGFVFCSSAFGQGDLQPASQDVVTDANAVLNLFNGLTSITDKTWKPGNGAYVYVSFTPEERANFAAYQKDGDPEIVRQLALRKFDFYGTHFLVLSLGPNRYYKPIAPVTQQDILELQKGAAQFRAIFEGKLKPPIDELTQTLANALNGVAPEGKALTVEPHHLFLAVTPKEVQNVQYYLQLGLASIIDRFGLKQLQIGGGTASFFTNRLTKDQYLAIKQMPMVIWSIINFHGFDPVAEAAGLEVHMRERPSASAHALPKLPSDLRGVWEGGSFDEDGVEVRLDLHQSKGNLIGVEFNSIRNSLIIAGWNLKTTNDGNNLEAEQSPFHLTGGPNWCSVPSYKMAAYDDGSLRLSTGQQGCVANEIWLRRNVQKSTQEKFCIARQSDMLALERDAQNDPNMKRTDASGVSITGVKNQDEINAVYMTNETDGDDYSASNFHCQTGFLHVAHSEGVGRGLTGEEHTKEDADEVATMSNDIRNRQLVMRTFAVEESGSKATITLLPSSIQLARPYHRTVTF